MGDSASGEYDTGLKYIASSSNATNVPSDVGEPSGCSHSDVNLVANTAGTGGAVAGDGSGELGRTGDRRRKIAPRIASTLACLVSASCRFPSSRPFDEASVRGLGTALYWSGICSTPGALSVRAASSLPPSCAIRITGGLGCRRKSDNDVGFGGSEGGVWLSGNFLGLFAGTSRARWANSGTVLLLMLLPPLLLMLLPPLLLMLLPPLLLVLLPPLLLLPLLLFEESWSRVLSSRGDFAHSRRGDFALSSRGDFSMGTRYPLCRIYSSHFESLRSGGSGSVVLGDWGVRLPPWPVLELEFLGESDECLGDALLETVEPGRSFAGFRSLFLGL
jgi:hypothetical protein